MGNNVIVGDFVFELKKNNWILTKYNGKNSDLIFPDSFEYNGQIITKYSVGKKAICDDDTTINIIVPTSVTCFEKDSFYYMYNSRDVYFNGTLNDWMNIKLLTTPVSSTSNFYILNPEGEIIKNGKRYSAIKDIIFPKDIKKIQNYQFLSFKFVKELIIPDTVEIIGDCAFDCMDSLEYIVLPKSIKKVGMTFCLLKKLNNVYYNGTIEDWCNIEFEYSGNPMEEAKNFYFLDEEGNVEFLGKKYKLLNELIIPNSITTIGNYQFSCCDNIEKIVLPNTLTTIKDNAFEGLINLKSIIIPETVTTLGEDVFKGCHRLVEIYDLTKTNYVLDHIKHKSTLIYHMVIIHKSLDEQTILLEDKDYIYACVNGEGYIIKYKGNKKDIIIPNSFTHNKKNIEIKYIHNYAFYKCDSLENIVIPNNIIDIFRYTFSECNNLKSVKLPKDIYEISEALFSNCKSLKEIEIPKNIKLIDNYAFKKCESLITISLPDGLRRIRNQVFADCILLKNIILPESLTKIDEFAFDDCSSLEKIYYKGSPKTRKKIILSDSNEPLIKATWYYFTENGDNETQKGSWWYYDTDGITIIEKIIN